MQSAAVNFQTGWEVRWSRRHQPRRWWILREETTLTTRQTEMEVGITFRGMQKNTLQRMGKFQSRIMSCQDALDAALNLTVLCIPNFQLQRGFCAWRTHESSFAQRCTYFSNPKTPLYQNLTFYCAFESLQKRGSTGPESISEDYTFFRENLPSSSLDKLLGLDHFRQYEIWDIFKVLPSIAECAQLVDRYFQYWVGPIRRDIKPVGS
jgi:hypothetical protein